MTNCESLAERRAMQRVGADNVAGPFLCRGGEMAHDELRLCRGKGRRVQARAPRQSSWTAAKRKAFLEHLGATCNVTFSAGAAGMTEQSAYSLRLRDAAFRADWGAALEQGYARLETMLIARAGGTAGRIDFDGGAHIDASEAVDSDLAMQLLTCHRNAVFGGPPKRRAGRAPRTASPDELERAILKQLSALNKRRGGSG